jgi:cell fate regulator YaaT (PSP1 superfamily)
MSALLPAPVAPLADALDQFVVSHGKSGVIGVFTALEPAALGRGQSVIVQSNRGVEIGAVLGRATILQARLFGATSSGTLLRRVTPQDETRRRELASLAQQIFDTSRAWAERDSLAIEILDVDLFFDGQQAIVQFVGKDTDTEVLAQALEDHFQLTIRLENLVVPVAEEKSGCDKPDCSRTADGGGGCTSCSTGGGCSTCGSGKVDMREYFGHLRTKMENRIPLA